MVGCNISNNNAGVSVDDDGDLIANYNNIAGNDVIGVWKENSPSVDATSNWWGDGSGPGGVGPGTGDVISDNVDYEPWLGEPWLGAEANAGVSHGHWYFTDADSIDANVPLDWSHHWLFQIANPTVGLTNPYITLTSDLPFVGFRPEPIIIDSNTVKWITASGYMPEGTDFPCHADEAVDTFPPGYSLSRLVSPQKLVDEITLQTVTATFTLEEALPDRNQFWIHIGFLPCVYHLEEVVTSEYHSGGSSIGPWHFQGSVGDRQVGWSANPSEVEIGETYQLTATFQSTKSPGFDPEPIYKPRVSTVFTKEIPLPSVTGTSTTIDYDGVSVTFGADNAVTWYPGILDLRRDVILEAVYLTSIKQETTEPGEYIVDAKTEADTEVTKSGSGTPTVTIAEYSGNPGTQFGGDTGKYIDVHIDDATDVDEIEIRLYYTHTEIAHLDESSLRLCWWDGSAWIECSDAGVHTGDINSYSGYIWARIRGDTTPTLADLTGTAFGGGGTVRKTGDVNGDGNVNVLDMIRMGMHWGETGPPGWIPEDVNQDGVINVLDMILVGMNWTG